MQFNLTKNHYFVGVTRLYKQTQRVIYIIDLILILYMHFLTDLVLMNGIIQNPGRKTPTKLSMT